MRPLTTADMNQILGNNSVTKRYFLGTYPACLAPVTGKRKYSYVTNSESHESRGVHWNIWMVNDGCLTFYDSFGRSPWDSMLPDFYRDIVNDFDNVKYTEKRTQSYSSGTCGYFSIHCLYILSLGLDFDFFFKDYSSDFENNDIVAYDIVNSL